MQQINFSAPNLISLCVDETVAGDIKGRIWHKYQEEAVPYENVAVALKIMNKLFDDVDYPQETVRIRMFRKQPGEPSGERTGKKELQPVRDGKELLEFRGKKASFLLFVKTRQHASWQGEIIWLEEDKKEQFLSFVELMALIDSALK